MKGQRAPTLAEVRFTNMEARLLNLESDMQNLKKQLDELPEKFRTDLENGSAFGPKVQLTKIASYANPIFSPVFSRVANSVSLCTNLLSWAIARQ